MALDTPTTCETKEREEERERDVNVSSFDCCQPVRDCIHHWPRDHIHFVWIILRIRLFGISFTSDLFDFKWIARRIGAADASCIIVRGMSCQQLSKFYQNNSRLVGAVNRGQQTKWEPHKAMASEREKLDKSKMNNSVKHIPKDAQVIMSILKELNVTEYEPRVINQLLEFTYRTYWHQTVYDSTTLVPANLILKTVCVWDLNWIDLWYLFVVSRVGYITCILDDAKIYANHAKKKVIDLDDVKLASQMTMEKAFTSPPPREVCVFCVRTVNRWPLTEFHANSIYTGAAGIGA